MLAWNLTPLRYTPNEPQTAASLTTTLAKVSLNIWHVSNNWRPLIFYMQIEQNRPLRYIQEACLSPMMPRDGGAKPSTKRRKSWPDRSCHENVARKWLATGWRIHPTSWLALVNLESIFCESHVKSDQSVGILAKRQPNSWEKLEFLQNFVTHHQYSFTLMFCEVPGFTNTQDALGEAPHYKISCSLAYIVHHFSAHEILQMASPVIQFILSHICKRVGWNKWTEHIPTLDGDFMVVKKQIAELLLNVRSRCYELCSVPETTNGWYTWNHDGFSSSMLSSPGGLHFQVSVCSPFWRVPGSSCKCCSTCGQYYPTCHIHPDIKRYLIHFNSNLILWNKTL